MKQPCRFTLAAAAVAILTLSADATPYTFSVGTEIPLGTISPKEYCSYVTYTGTATLDDRDKTDDYYYVLGTQNANSTFTFSLSNATLGDYILSFKTGMASGSATGSVMVSNSSGYAYSLENFSLADTSWNVTDEHRILLPSLPQGDFAVTVTCVSTENSNNYCGNYGHFVLYNYSDASFIPPVTGGFDISDAVDAGKMTVANGKVDSDNSNEGKAVGSTGSKTVLTFALSFSEYAKYGFSYKTGASGCSSTVNWTLYDNKGAQVWTTADEITDTGNWHCSEAHDHAMGTFDPGLYTLKMTVASVTGSYAGNFGFFEFAQEPATECTVTVPTVANASYTVTVGGSAATGSDGAYTVEIGSDVVVEYTADEGYYLYGHKSFTFDDISENTTVTAPAAVKAWTLDTAKYLPLGTAKGDNWCEYTSHTSCTIDDDAGLVVGSTGASTTFSAYVYNATAGDCVLTMMGGASSLTANYTVTVDDGADYSRSMTIDQANTGSWTPSQTAQLTLDSLPQGVLQLFFTINSTTGSVAGNYGYFNFFRRTSGTPYTIAAGETLVWQGEELADVEGGSTAYGFNIEEGGRLTIDLDALGVPGCEGTAESDGSLVLPRLTLAPGMTIASCVTFRSTQSYDLCYAIDSDGRGTVSLEAPDADYAAEVGVVKGTVDDMVAIAAAGRASGATAVVTLAKSAQSATLVPGVALALADGVSTPANVSVKIGDVDATGYYTAASLVSNAGGVISPALDESKVEPAIGAVETEGGAFAVTPGNVKAGLYYGLQASGEVDGVYADDAASFVQAQSDGQTLSLEVDVDAVSPVRFFKVKVTDVAPAK